MTPKQNSAIASIARAALDKSGANAEFKEWSVRPLGDDAAARYFWVHVVTGMTGDEGTLAAMFCRYRGTFCVGPRGGIDAKTASKHATAAHVKKYPLIFGFES